MHAWSCAVDGDCGFENCLSTGQAWNRYWLVGACPALSTAVVEYTQPFGTFTWGAVSTTWPTPGVGTPLWM